MSLLNFSHQNWLRLSCVVIGLLAILPTLRAAPKAPTWVTAVTARPPSFDYGKAHAAVLLDDELIDVDSDGTFTKRTRWVVRIRTKDGRENARATLPYNANSTRVQSMQGWLIRASGEVVVYDKKQCIDAVAFGDGSLFSEARTRIIDATDEADAGAVFAYEAVVGEKSVFNQECWYFSSKLPVELSSITVTLPKDWRVTSQTFNSEPIIPTIKEQSHTWTLTRLPAVEAEPMAPPTHASKTWIALDIRPPAGARTPRVNFESWADVSRYFTPKYDSASAPTPAIKAKAAELTGGLASPWARIAALGRFAQKVNYVSIVLNSAAAGGMTPRDATKVLQCNYGDCKDKANLLRALLRAEGVDSFPLIVYSGDPSSVRPAWPSPTQFNHSIIAIKVDESVNVPGMLIHPEFGRLVIFDPTNANTPPGWLAEEDCGGLGLLLAGENGKLIALPEMQKEDNRTELTITANLHPDGSIEGTLEEKYIGLASTDERRRLRELSSTDYRKTIERWIARSLPAARLGRVEPSDHFEQASFTLTTDFAAPSHGKSMRETLLVFKPLLVGRRSGTSLKKEKRTQPVVIENSFFAEKSTIELPKGYAIDELPQPVELKASFGNYSSRVTVQNRRQIVVERTSEYIATLVPAADYESVRSFFEKVQKAEQTPVVLKKVPRTDATEVTAP